MRRGAGEVRHRRDRRRSDRLLHRLPSRRLEVPARRRVVPPAADLRRQQTQDPLEQLRRVLRPAVLSWANRPRRYAMTTHKLISADSHIVEPPDLYTHRIEPKYRERAPRMERMETPTGRKSDAGFIEGRPVGSLGAVMQAGQRFEDPSQIDFLGTWEDVRLGAYDPQAMIKENEIDGVWGACLQPSQGLFWYRISDSGLLSAICRVYNDWIADFCRASPDRLKGIAMLNVDDVEEGCQELERCAKLGLVGAFIPVSPLPDRPYRHPIYERLWWTAQDVGVPLDRKSTRLNSSHLVISYAVFCLKKKKTQIAIIVC